MRIFVDACIDPRVVEVLGGHDARTAFDLGWQNLKDHVLLGRSGTQFDVLLTADRGFEYEHNLRELSIGIVIVHVGRNKLADYRAIASRILAAVGEVTPGSVVHVRAPSSR